MLNANLASFLEIPHPLAQEVKALFLDLLPSTPISTPASTGTSTPSLTHSPSSASSDLVSEGGPDPLLCSQLKSSRRGLPSEFPSQDTNTEADSGNEDWLASTPRALCFSLNSMPEHRSLFSGSVPKDQPSWDWHEILTQGVKTGETDTTPALHLVQNKANWGFDGLNEISRELVWLAVQPTSSATLQLRDIRRVVAFALKFKKVLSATFEQAVGELFSRSLVDTANGIFLHAWFISYEHPLFVDTYRPVHIQMSIRLAALLAELYVTGLIQHDRFHSCICVIMCQVHHYEGVAAMRVMVEILGKGNSHFWKLQTANQVEKGAFSSCTTTCTCLDDKGMFQKEKYIVGLDGVKETFAETFLGNVTAARLPMLQGRFSDGLKSFVMPGGAVTAKIVNWEIRNMFLKLGLRAEGRM